MLIAEGSDWFWWYGDDHSSDHDLEFDDLFRRHVRNVYRALDKPIPEELFVTNITTQPPAVEIQPPTGFIEPVIDGEVSYFEWLGSGCVDGAAAAGAMHQVAGRDAGITLVEFGFNLENLFVRVDGSRPMHELLAEGLDLTVRFLKPSGIRVLVRAVPGGIETRLLVRNARGDWEPQEPPGLKAAARQVAEIQLPFSAMNVSTHAPVAFIVTLHRGVTEIEHHPRHRPIEFEVPDKDFAALNWTA